MLEKCVPVAKDGGVEHWCKEEHPMDTIVREEHYKNLVESVEPVQERRIS